MTMSGDRLVVNADASLGSMAVEILDADGQPLKGLTKDDADLFTGNSVRHTVTWNGSPDVKSLKGRPMALKFYLDRCKLYSFVFQSAG